ncbi:MAG TPA: FliM/FliN family flagellar motor switch protein [Polyangiaceae bacterium]|nr:FliM/FliN family flagellar motor switch protein [Polyangiaceae bacterium]
MSGGRNVRPFPWQALERLSRDAARAGRRVRQKVSASLDLARLPAALSAVLGSDTAAYLDGVRIADAPRTRLPPILRATNDAAAIWLYCEAALVETALGHVLARTTSVSDPTGGLDPSLAGACAAIATEVVRRAHGAVPFEIGPATSPTSAGCQLDFTLVVDGRAFRVSAWVEDREAHFATTPTRPLDALGSLPIEIPLVTAVATLDAAEFAALGVGDAFLPGAGWWLDHTLTGDAVLASAAQELGVAVELSPAGEIVVRGGTRSLTLEVSEVSEKNGPEEGALVDAAMDAPIVVRLELGSVSMSAREWAQLGPGDVIETGQRLAEPVVLRVGGQEVARGELVDIEGELGVKIRSLSGGAN